MAGYIGTKAVLLSTTAASVTGDADIGGDLTVDTSTLFVDSTNNRVGVGTVSPTAPLDVVGDVTARSGTILADQYANYSGNMTLNSTGSLPMVFQTNSTERMRIDSSGNVGIGTESPASIVGGSDSNPILTIAGADSVNVPSGDKVGSLSFKSGDTSWTAVYADGVSGEIASVSESATGAAYGLAFYTGTITGSDRGERVRIDRSGNLLVGTTSNAPTTTAGINLGSNNKMHATRSGGASAYFNRLTSDGGIVEFAKDGTVVGGIGSRNAGTLTTSYIQFYAGSGNSVGFTGTSSTSVLPALNGSTSDNLIDLGASTVRFDDVYATNGTIQTSDRNEKQDIAEIDEAERRVAVAAKGLLRKFRWKDAVAEKGDDARIHFGIIAQDLQAAFEAEGLDAGRYAMFISSTWWEADRVIPAVEAQDAVYETQLDEDGNEVQVLVSEAVEAQPEQVVTDTYETQAEAPEGAVERTRLGVRYPELLAFIIGAM